MIDNRVIEVHSGHHEIPFSSLTKEIKEDYTIITYYLAEQLPENTPFDLSSFEIIEYSENLIVVLSNEKEWLIRLDNIYTYDEKLGIEYRFYVIRE